MNIEEFERAISVIKYCLIGKNCEKCAIAKEKLIKAYHELTIENQGYKLRDEYYAEIGKARAKGEDI